LVPRGTRVVRIEPKDDDSRDFFRFVDNVVDYQVPLIGKEASIRRKDGIWSIFAGDSYIQDKIEFIDAAIIEVTYYTNTCYSSDGLRFFEDCEVKVFAAGNTQKPLFVFPKVLTECTDCNGTGTEKALPLVLHHAKDPMRIFARPMYLRKNLSNPYSKYFDYAGMWFVMFELTAQRKFMPGRPSVPHSGLTYWRRGHRFALHPGNATAGCVTVRAPNDEKGIPKQPYDEMVEYLLRCRTGRASEQDPLRYKAVAQMIFKRNDNPPVR